ncbi:hypothetical protein CsatA_018334 [Cannabis sativa]
MDQCRDRYRSRKYKLKVKYFDNKMTQSHPKLIPEEQWKWLVFYWSLEDFKNISSRNINNRSRVDIAHTSGSKSFIRIKVDQAKYNDEVNSKLWMELLQQMKMRFSDLFCVQKSFPVYNDLA